MLDNIKLMVMGKDKESGGLRMIEVKAPALIQHALAYLANFPPAEVIGFRLANSAPIQVPPESFATLMPTDPLEEAKLLRAPKDILELMERGDRMTRMLMDHAGESGQSEGAVETLARILETHKAAMMQRPEQPAPPPPTPYPTGDPSAPKVTAAAAAAEASGLHDDTKGDPA